MNAPEFCPKKTQKNSRTGFGFIEAVVVMAVMGVVASMTFVSFSNLNRAETLQSERNTAESLLRKARSLTLGNMDDSRFGVRFEPRKMTLFKGSTYESSTEKIEEILNPSVSIIEVVLNGGGSDVVFDKLTGETENFGNIVFSDSRNGTTSLGILRTGLSQ